MKYSFDGSDELPPFNEWLNMFVDGLKYLIVCIIYLFIPALILIVISTALILTTHSYVTAPNFSISINIYIVILVIVGIIITALPFFFSMMALPHIVKNGELNVLLEVKNLLNLIKGIGWGRYIAAIVLLTIFSLSLVGLKFIPSSLNLGTVVIYLFGAVLSLVVGSYLDAFRGRLLALLYQEGIREK